MIMATWAFTEYLATHNARLLSYLDNRFLLANVAEKTPTVLHKMKWATDGLGLLLNPEKTKTFATTAIARSSL